MPAITAELERENKQLRLAIIEELQRCVSQQDLQIKGLEDRVDWLEKYLASQLLLSLQHEKNDDTSMTHLPVSQSDTVARSFRRVAVADLLV